MQIGKAYKGELLEISGAYELVPEAIYQLEIRTDQYPVDNDIDRLVSEMEKRFGIKVVYVRSRLSTGKTLVMQFEPSGIHSQQFFTAAVFLAVLPEILALIGLVMVGVGLYLVAITTPIWILILLVIGIVFLAFGVPIGSIVSAPFKSAQVQKQQQK